MLYTSPEEFKVKSSQCMIALQEDKTNDIEVRITVLLLINYIE